MSNNQQLACTYAALILEESGKLDAASIQAVTKAAGVEVSSGMAHAYAGALASVNISEVLSNIAFSGGAAAPSGSAPAAAGGAAPAAAAKKEEPEEEDDDEMGFGLFD